MAKTSTPSCTAVRGCPNAADVLTFKAGKRTVRACGMHVQRWLRHRDFGSAEPQAVGTIDSKHVRRNTRRAQAKLAELIDSWGEEWLLEPGQGLYTITRWRIRAQRRPSHPRGEVGARLIQSLEARGWIKLQRNDDDGIFASVTGKGRFVTFLTQTGPVPAKKKGGRS